jgi:hypothetical protein
MGRFVRHRGAKTVRLRDEIRQGIRQLVAVLVSVALPGTSLPADSLRLASSSAPQARFAHALLLPGGLDAFSNTPGRRAGSSSTVPNAKGGPVHASIGLSGLRKSLRPPGTPTMGLARVPFPVPPAPPNPPSNISTIG